MQRYRHVEVWSRYDDNRVIIYRCLQNLGSLKYMVDRAEFVRAPVTGDALLKICADQLEMFNAGRVPRCIRAELSTCLAPCAGRPSAEDYMKTVALARRFLEAIESHRDADSRRNPA